MKRVTYWRDNRFQVIDVATEIVGRACAQLASQGARVVKLERI